MKLTKTWPLLALAVLFGGLTSCSEKEDVAYPSEGKEIKNVALKISASSLTRGESAPVGTGTTVAFNDGYIYFVSKTGHQIVHRVEIAPSGQSEADASGKTLKVTVDELTTGTTINNIPVEAGDKVFVIANTDAVENLDGGSFSQVEAALLAANDETDGSGSIGNVTLFGGSALEFVTKNIEDEEGETVETEVYAVTIDVNPAVTARIEVPFLEAKGAIESFTLKGIYVGRTYDAVQMNGVIPSGATELGTSTDGAAFVAEYASKTSGVLYDTPDAASDACKQVKPAAGTWAYNVFTYNAYYTDPEGTSDVSGYIGRSPSVVFVIEDIVTTATADVTFDPDATYYITVQGFLDKNKSNAEIPVLTPGYIYRMTGGLEVSEKTVTDKPNVEQIDILVDIELAKWEIMDVDPKL